MGMGTVTRTAAFAAGFFLITDCDTIAAQQCGAGGAVAGVTVPSAAQSPTIAKVCGQGKIRAAVAPFAPHGFQDLDGSFRGAAVEIIAPEIARMLGVQLEVLPIGWDTVVAGLQAGQYELITTGLTYTPERDKIIDYALTAVGGTCYVVRGDSGIDNIEDLNSPDVKIGVYTGTSWETDLPKVFPNAKFDAAIEGAGGGYRLPDLLAKRIDAAPIDNVAAMPIAANYPSLRVVPQGEACLTNPNPIDRVGIGLPQDEAFRTFVVAVVEKNRAAIDEKMNSYMSPTYIPVGQE